MSNYILDPHPSGLFVRRGIPADPYVIGEVESYAAFRIAPGDVVLDLGANIGAMSHRFLSDGAKHVVAVEPFPANVEMVRKNLSTFEPSRYTILEAAVVGAGSGDTIEINTTDTNFGMISRVRHDVDYAVITGSLTVGTEKFSTLVEHYRPDAIKCDIEGGEMDFLEDLAALPAHVTRLAIEWHAFAEDLEGMFGGYVDTDRRLTTEAGFQRISQSGAMIPNQHSAMMCVYAR